MAAYAATVTVDIDDERISRNLSILVGKCDITNYNTTGAEITGITSKFATLLVCVCEGLSDNGYLVRWDRTDSCFHAFYAQPEHDHNFTIIGGTAAAGTDTLAVKALVLGKEEATNKTVVGADNATKGGVVQSTAGASAEVASDVDIGVVNFYAIGTYH
tara:strand:- start:1094 stop:1570 length:477 start_codon:yes stop_codon:yes gene_type:complete